MLKKNKLLMFLGQSSNLSSYETYRRFFLFCFDEEIPFLDGELHRDEEIDRHIKIFKSLFSKDFPHKNINKFFENLMSKSRDSFFSIDGYPLLLYIGIKYSLNLNRSIVSLCIACSELEMEHDATIKYSYKYDNLGTKSNLCSLDKIISNIFRFIISIRHSPRLKEPELKKEAFINTPKEFQQEAMQTTFKMVEEELKNIDLGRFKNIDLSKFLKEEITVPEDFSTNKDYMCHIFNDKKISSRFFTNNKPHFMNKLVNDKLVYDKVNNRFYFKKLYKSLLISYTDKYLLINIDKKQAIKGLNEALKGLDILNGESIEKQKEFIKELINLINNTNTNYCPFVTIGKALGMNKNEARNYTKKILNSINPKVFDNEYEKNKK